MKDKKISTPSTAMTRREMLTKTIAGAAAFTLVGQLLPALGGETSAAQNKEFSEALTKIKSWLADCTVKSRIEYNGGLKLHTPCVNGIYRGIWPDDFLWPIMVDRSLMDAETLTKALEFVTTSVLSLPCVPDRVEHTGVAVMQPGLPQGPHGTLMPLHLPAAWVRLLDYAQAWGAKIPKKAEWATLIQRSFDKLAFDSGLAYVDPKERRVGFGFHDPCAITGMELMSSLVLYRGFQRAAALFADDITPDQKKRWLAQAQGIQDNLHRLWSEEDGAYFAGSVDCRQVNVWGNGLAYWLSDAEKKQRIVAWYKANRQKIFLNGYTRQIAEEKGWQRQLVKVKLGTYTNGGFWSVGTGFVLPAIADQDPDFAIDLTKQLVANIKNTSFAEWIPAEGKGSGATGFLAGLAMPGLGLQSVIEKKPLLNYF
jgi:hypothetical protein